MKVSIVVALVAALIGHTCGNRQIQTQLNNDLYTNNVFPHHSKVNDYEFDNDGDVHSYFRIQSSIPIIGSILSSILDHYPENNPLCPHPSYQPLPSQNLLNQNQFYPPFTQSQFPYLPYPQSFPRQPYGTPLHQQSPFFSSSHDVLPNPQLDFLQSSYQVPRFPYAPSGKPLYGITPPNNELQDYLQEVYQQPASSQQFYGIAVPQRPVHQPPSYQTPPYQQPPSRQPPSYQIPNYNRPARQPRESSYTEKEHHKPLFNSDQKYVPPLNTRPSDFGKYQK